ncbi:MAG: glycosyltransferase family 4 protein [Desulfopila sp.]
MKRIAIVTDAWHPQINGVVTTLSHTSRELTDAGFRVKIVNPQMFRSIPCPTYPEIRLALAGTGDMARELRDFAPHAVHIATEGPLGWVARRICVGRNFAFTTSYHTRFPEYIRARLPVPLPLSYSVVRTFHRAATRIMVATTALGQELARRGFRQLALWTRGVDTDIFRPRPTRMFTAASSPVMIYVGRVAIEKNIKDFLSLNIPGTKVVVGDGPARKQLEKAYPDTLFVGYRTGAELAHTISSADVMVFPSRTDTFGVVMLEAMACGVPVAAYPVTGPINIIKNGVNGWLDSDLATAIDRALAVSPESCLNTALNYSWQASARQFLNNLAIQSQPLV